MNAEDYSSSACNGVKTDWGRGRLMLSPKSKRQSFPCASSYMKRDLTNYSSFTTSDDERDSISSKPMSDHSSIVLLQPIHLKTGSHNASIRHQLTSDGRSDVDLLSYIFGSPFHSLDRVKSRSSDTINSIPRCPPTPKFPVPSSDSSSLTRLLQELAGDSSAVPQEITPSPFAKRPAAPDATSSPRGLGSPKIRRNCNTRDGPFKHGGALAEAERKRRHRMSAQPMGGPGGVAGSRLSVNPYQIKRRTTHTVPPRHCRSLDYIPSDREDSHSHVSSNASSTCGSPRVTQRHSYLLPLIFGKQTVAPSHPDNVSVSSLASSSEMSRSDPAINTHDSSSAAYESEYDNYRPGMASDEDFYVTDPVSDVDLLDVEDLNVDDVTVSDRFSLDMPVPRFQKKITDV